MKTTTFTGSLALAGCMLLAGCGTQNSSLSQIGTQVLTDVLMGATGTTTDGSAASQAGGALGNILGSVLGGTTKPTQRQIIGSWTYSQPGCAFTSDKLLAQAGGEVVAAEIKKKLLPTYQKLGVKAGNTSLVLKEDNTFSASFAGKAFSGTYTFDEASARITLKGMLLTINGYMKRNSDGVALLFESSKLLTLLQTVSALSGNTSVQAVGELSKSYDGLRLGFDFR